MRTINVILPDWTDGRNIYILAGMELAAYQYIGDSLKIKTSRCNKCGKCCEIKNCNKLRENRTCSLDIKRPFLCCITNGINHVPDCMEMFE